MDKLKFIPIHKTKDGIVSGELRKDSPFEQFICNIQEDWANHIIKSNEEQVAILTEAWDMICDLGKGQDEKTEQIRGKIASIIFKEDEKG